MGKAVFEISMSLDGFIAGPNDGVDEPLGVGGERLHSWLGDDRTDAENELIESAERDIGAVICGRRTYDNSGWQPGYGPAGKTPVFVVSHDSGEGGRHEGGPFTFVDSVQSALKQAQEVAGDKEVSVIGGADIGQQMIRDRLVDEIVLHVVPVLLGDGRRLFDNLGDRIELRPAQVVSSPTTTHLRYVLVR